MFSPYCATLMKFAPFQYATPFVTAAFGNQLWPVPMASKPRDHRRIAKVLHPLFTADSLAPCGGALRAQAAALVDGIAPLGACEATGELGDQYACGALLAVFGLPAGDEVVDRVVGLIHTAKSEDEGPLIAHLLALAHHYQLASDGQPLPGIAWRLFDALDGGAFTTEELLGMLIFIFVVGTETLTPAIWFALLHLARSPQLRSASATLGVRRWSLTTA